MTMGTETWYVLEDGSVGDPREIAPAADGRLRHKDGRAVAYRPDGETPRSRGVDAVAERANVASAKKAPKEPRKPVETKEMKPEEPKAGYQTRETAVD